MNCRQCRELLDNLLVAQLTESERALLLEHAAECPECARQYKLAGEVLDCLTVCSDLRASPQLKERIMSATVDTSVSVAETVSARSFGKKAAKWALALSAAAALVLAARVAFREAPGPAGPRAPAALSLLAQACAAEERFFDRDQVVHLVNEIIIKPVADPTLAKMRWMPLLSLEATGKPRFNQLTLPAEPGKGYTVVDESWYDRKTGRFARVLKADGKPIFASSFDGKVVSSLEVTADGKARIVKNPVTKDFHPPKSPADYLGIAAGFRSRLDEKDGSLVRDVGKTKLEDGSEARVVKVSFSEMGPQKEDGGSCLFTVRNDNNTIAQIELVASGESLLVVRRVKIETAERPGVGWDLAGVEQQVAGARGKPRAGILPDMVILNVSVKHMVEKAGFQTYVLAKDPDWTGKPQIVDILDVASPPQRMFATAYPAKDGRHVVLIQSPSYNRMAGPMVKHGKLVYTSGGGVKVWSGPKDKALAEILLQSARFMIKDPPSKDATGYLLETPSGTFPALAINGQLSEKELHTLIDGLVPAQAQ
jgi:hypothetical protein